jgi:hypothetical protein
MVISEHKRAIEWYAMATKASRVDLPPIHGPVQGAWLAGMRPTRPALASSAWRSRTAMIDVTTAPPIRNTKPATCGLF